MKHEGLATAFHRLDQEVLELRRRVALSALWAWNWESKIYRPEPRIYAASRRVFRRSRIELILCALVASLALSACNPEEDRTSEPQIAGPCPGPPFVELRAAHVLADGTTLLIVSQ